MVSSPTGLAAGLASWAKVMRGRTARVVAEAAAPLARERRLTRFFGSLGVALGASMIIILPVALLASLIWIGYLGLLFVGRVPGGRPPAWEAGEAIPWPRPGDEAPAQPKPADDAIEAEATEVPGEEAAEAPDAPQQPPRQKRKRRR